MFRNRFKTSAIGLAISSMLVLMLSLATAAPAFASGGGGGSINSQITGGTTLTVDNVGTGFSTTGADLTATNTTFDINMPLVVTDTRGTGVGWSLTLATQQFYTGSDTSFHTLPDNAIALHALSDTTTLGSGTTLGCVTNSACTVPTALATPATLTEQDMQWSSGSGVSVVPPGSGGYTGNQLVDITPGQGMGQMNIEADFTATVPADTYAGTYTGNMSVTINAGPSA